ncbi:hypothetical protein D3C79_667670 [compost metagenome]
MCGTIRPTKPMEPLIATSTPVSSEQIRNATRRTERAFKPRVTAVCSPAISAFSARAMPSNRVRPSSTLMAGIGSSSQRARPRPPSIQNITAELARWSPRNSNRLAMAIITKATATPHSSKRSLSRRPWRLAIASTSSMLHRAPTKAASGKVSTPSTSPMCSTTSTAPSVAPEVTPSRCGSAKGLRVVACSTAPIIARPPPTSAARSMRGTRISQTICSWPVVQAGASGAMPKTLNSSTRHTTSTGTGAAPKPSDTTQDTSSRPISPSNSRR